MKIGDIVEYTGNDQWANHDNIKVNDQLEISKITGDGWLKFKNKTYNHNTKYYKLTTMYKVGDKISINSNEVIDVSIVSDRKWKGHSYMKGDYIIYKINTATIQLQDDEDDTDPWIVKKEDFERLISPKSTEEIVGYELIKDTPDCKVGTKIELDGSYLSSIPYEDGIDNCRWPISSLSNTEWFKPAYKPKEIELKNIGSRNATIVVSKKGIFIKENNIPIIPEKLAEFLKSNSNFIDLGPHAIRLADSNTRIFRVGCEAENNLVSYNEVNDVYNAYLSI